MVKDLRAKVMKQVADNRAAAGAGTAKAPVPAAAAARAAAQQEFRQTMQRVEPSGTPGVNFRYQVHR